MSTIRLAIAGVGNCASALVQGIHHYSDKKDSVGLMHPTLGGYTVSDIQIVCGFDVDERKTNMDLAQAINSEPNCADQFADIPDEIGALVYRGPVLDGVADHMHQGTDTNEFDVEPSEEPVNIESKLNEHNVDILVCYLPVGSTEGVERYAEAAINTGVGFVNAIPEFISSDSDWAKKFEDAEIPVVGDDIKSQLGATITHRSLVQLFNDRGVNLRDTYQLNVGGNNDFKNMLDRSRLGSKKKSKTSAVNEILEEPLNPEEIHIGPSDFVPFLNDQKTAFMRLKGDIFGESEVEIDVQLRVQDSPNSAGSAVDAIRCAKIGLDHGVGGPLIGPSAFTMKHPPEQMADETAKQRIREFADIENR